MHVIREQRGLIRAITTAMATKPFLILAGVSGSGKTQLARRLAAGVAAGPIEEGRYSRRVVEGADLGAALIQALAASGVSPELAASEDDEAWIDIRALEKLHDETRVAVEGGGRRSSLSYDDIYQNRVAFLPVRPDWKDARDMWGRYNPLTGLFYPTRALRVALHATLEFARLGNQAGRHVLILDEMNLSRVEYFMSDLLSLMESGAYEGEDGRLYLGEMVDIHPFASPLWSESPPQLRTDRRASQEHLFQGALTDEWLQVYGLLSRGVSNQSFERLKFDINAICLGADWARLVPPRLPFPPNLTIVGTVNVDETTFALSPKVLDRAFVVEFNHMDFRGVCGPWEGYSAIADEIDALYTILAGSGQPFGYRVVREMLAYLATSGRSWERDGDFLIASKLLPKIRGTEEQLADGLRRLLAYALGVGEAQLAAPLAASPFPATLEVLTASIGGIKPRHPRTANRVLLMLRELRFAGVTSFM